MLGQSDVPCLSSTSSVLFFPGLVGDHYGKRVQNLIEFFNADCFPTLLG